MMIDDKIFVAGGTGMVGSAIIRDLKKKGYTNIVSNFNKRPPKESGSVNFVNLDLRIQKDVEEFFKLEKPKYVFLSAAKVGGILANNTYKGEFIYDNIMISTNIIHASYKYGVNKLLNLGSSCIYPKNCPQPMKEEYLLTGSLEPTNEPYAIAKICAIKLCRYYNEQYNTNFVSVMPTNLYGPNDNYDLKNSHVLPALIRKFHLAKCLENDDWDSIRKDLNKNPIDGVNGNEGEQKILNVLKDNGIIKEDGSVIVILWGSGEPYREFLHVDDLADACVFIMEKYDFEDVGEFINIGTGEDLKIKELASIIREIVGFRGEIKWDISKPDGAPRKLLDVSRLLKKGWQYRIGLRDGIKSTYYENYIL
ncbi:MAG: GDP-L-fucose synthase [Proteobacteria bacterium]|nr:GDP-L-fucose synthase [Pseudomonadota bacterium]